MTKSRLKKCPPARVRERRFDGGSADGTWSADRREELDGEVRLTRVGDPNVEVTGHGVRRDVHHALGGQEPLHGSSLVVAHGEEAACAVRARIVRLAEVSYP